MSSHSDDESQRLSAYYAALSDSELQKLADDIGSLTDAARTALTTEINRRGLTEMQAEEQPEPEPIDLRQLVTLRKFRDLPEALLAKGSLESAGIECFLGDDNMVRLDWFISNLLGGIKLLVRAEEAEAAEKILTEPIPESFEVEGLGNYEQPHCPNCQSLDVGFEELIKSVAYTSAWVGLPLPVHYKAWRCHACQHEWRDDNFPSREVTPPSAGPVE
jgi:Putative prokaryotic signal transducing protein